MNRYLEIVLDRGKPFEERYCDARSLQTFNNRALRLENINTGVLIYT